MSTVEMPGFLNLLIEYLRENEKFAKPFSPVHMGPRSNLLSKKMAPLTLIIPISLHSATCDVCDAIKEIKLANCRQPILGNCD